MTNTTEYQNIPGDFNTRKMAIDFFLMIFSFLAAFLYKRKNLEIGPDYLRLVGVILISWIISSLLSGKFRENPTERRRFNRMEPLFTSSVLFIGLITLWLFGLRWTSYSRMIIFGFFGLYIFLEILILSGNYLPFFQYSRTRQRLRFSYLLFSFDLLIMAVGFYLLNYLKSGSITLQKSYQPIFMLLMFLWFICGLLIHHFQIRRERNYLRAIYPHLKSAFVVISIVSVIVFVLRSGFSRIMVFGSLALVTVLELLFVTLHYLVSRLRQLDPVEVSLFNAPLLSQNGIVEEAVKKHRYSTERISFGNKGYGSAFFKKKLQNVYLHKQPRLFQLIDQTVELSSIDILRAEFVHHSRSDYLEDYTDQGMEILINTRPLNRFGAINPYLQKVNRKLRERGIFAGVFEPCEYRKFYFMQRYPLLLANFLYFFDFLWHRVFAKLFILKQIYFFLTRGKNRVISFAEGLGRLYFHGFEILTLGNEGHVVYFVVKKVSGPLAGKNPSYGLLFRQKRIGKEGKSIHIYKMRTMHPYSEFIHRYIYHQNQLDDKGKIRDDFRITSWGRFMRRLWLDELPMLINWIRGDVALVGVRPLSETFYATYPEELKKQRIRTRPGLIPPFYADLPRSIQEVYRSEEKYLEKYFQHPFKTKCRYLFRALKNILFHRAKSR